MKDHRIRRSIAATPEITRVSYGTRAGFARLVSEMDSALGTYRNVDVAGAHTPACVGLLRDLNAAAAHALGDEPALARLSERDVQGLALVKVEPVIADIGLEVDDTIGSEPAGVFGLHLATSSGREVPIEVEGKSYRRGRRVRWFSTLIKPLPPRSGSGAS